MINEAIRKLYYPIHEDDWVVIETDHAFYELRMGGYRVTTSFERGTHKVTHEFSGSVVIEEVFTDDESLYFRLSNEEYLLHSFTHLDASGEMSASVRILTKDEFYEAYGEPFLLDPSLRKLRTDGQGNSL